MESFWETAFVRENVVDPERVMVNTEEPGVPEISTTKAALAAVAVTARIETQRLHLLITAKNWDNREFSG